MLRCAWGRGRIANIVLHYLTHLFVHTDDATLTHNMDSRACVKMTTSLSPREHLSILKTSIEVQLPFSVMRPSNLPLLKKGRDIRIRANSQHTRLPHHVALLLGVLSKITFHATSEAWKVAGGGMKWTKRQLLPKPRSEFVPETILLQDSETQETVPAEFN